VSIGFLEHPLQNAYLAVNCHQVCDSVFCFVLLSVFALTNILYILKFADYGALIFVIIPANLPFSHLQQKMPEIQLGVHTIRSHGASVARIHMHDWLILLLLVVIDAVLNIIEPFHRFVGEGMLTDLRYPLKDNTIPFWAVPVCFSSKNCILLRYLRLCYVCS
jgi:hypothetical protein